MRKIIRVVCVIVAILLMEALHGLLTLGWLGVLWDVFKKYLP